jgi:hypothetical protein
LLLILSTVGVGCAADTGDASAPLASGSAALAGTLLDAGVAAPYDSVVKIRLSGSNKPCTATKIGARRLLTAASCVQEDGIVAGRPLRITNANNGAFAEGAVWDVARVLTHPSWENVYGGLFDDVPRPSYDLALIDLTGDLPPAWPSLPLRAEPVSFESGPIVGFSCTDGGRKSVVTQMPVDLEDLALDAGISIDVAIQVLAYDIAGYPLDAAPASACSVDRGAPFLVQAADGAYQVAGVLHSIGAGDFFYSARTGNAYRWLQQPEKNHIAHGERGTLLNLDSNLCAGVRGQSFDPLAQLAQYYCETPSQLADHEYWQLISRPGGVYQLKNGRSGLCMVTPNNNENTPVVQGTCAAVGSGSAQAWWVLPRGNGVIIRNSANGKCLAPLGGSRNPNALLVQTLCNAAAPAPTQIWSFIR